VQRTIVLLVTAVTFGLLAVTVLCLTQEKLISHRLAGNDFLALVFEVISALGTVGLSTGITGELTSGSKLTIIACMFVGKVGPLAFLTAWISRAKPFPYKFPEQNIPVG
jgi:trk system potassium uptake protein TrkH